MADPIMAELDHLKRLVIVGATGMVGGYALRYALDHSAVERVTAIGRRPVGISHAKLTEVLHRDFTDCSALASALSGRSWYLSSIGPELRNHVPAPDADLAPNGYYYNGVRTIQRKSEFVVGGGYGGAMVWEVGQGYWNA